MSYVDFYDGKFDLRRELDARACACLCGSMHGDYTDYMRAPLDMVRAALRRHFKRVKAREKFVPVYASAAECLGAALRREWGLDWLRPVSKFDAAQVIEEVQWCLKA